MPGRRRVICSCGYPPNGMNTGVLANILISSVFIPMLLAVLRGVLEAFSVAGLK